MELSVVSIVILNVNGVEVCGILLFIIYLEAESEQVSEKKLMYEY